jgi:hypothetical protein
MCKESSLEDVIERIKEVILDIQFNIKRRNRIQVVLERKILSHWERYKHEYWEQFYESQIFDSERDLEQLIEKREILFRRRFAHFIKP